MTRKRIVYLLILMAVACAALLARTMIQNGQNSDLDLSLDQSVEYGNKVHEKIETLYEQEYTEIETRAEKLLELKKVSNAVPEITIEREAGRQTYAWFDCETYERHSITLQNELQELFDRLFDDRDVREIILSEDYIGLKIGEDILFYFPSAPATPVDAPEHSRKINDNWYHVWFEYGV